MWAKTLHYENQPIPERWPCDTRREAANAIERRAFCQSAARRGSYETIPRFDLSARVQSLRYHPIHPLFPFHMKTFPSRFAAILFDLDGTLVDTAPDLCAAASRMRVRRNMPPLPPGDARLAASGGAPGMMRAAFGIGTDHPDYVALRLEYLDEYASAVCVHSRMLDESAILLRALDERRIPWGIVTNKLVRFTQPLTKALGLDQRAAVIISGDTTPVMKPDPLPILEACRRLNLKPGDCLYVGDDRRDVDAAKACGMPCAICLFGYASDHADVMQWGAEFYLNNAADLLAQL